MKTVILFVVLLATQIANAQLGCDLPNSYCIDNITINACTGTIYDDGGGGAYSDDLYTMTICPDTPGDVIQLAFSAFSLQTSPNGNNSDYLTIFDGNTTGAPSLGNYTGTSLQGLPVTATINNATGCLTLVFNPNGNPNAGSPGFEAQISCTTPCANPVAEADFAGPFPINGEEGIRVCVNSPVNFEDDGSFAQPGFSLAEYVWNFDDGSIDNTSGANVSHVFTEPGEYLVTLSVLDDNGCSSLNLEPMQVLVSTVPEFPDIDLIQTDYCFGQDITLDAGEVINPTWTALPPQVVSGQTYLADGAGFSYSSSLIFDFFEPGATLEDCSDLFSILVNMEHSYMGDLGVLISCPNGTTVNLVTWGTNGGGGTFLGEAVDDESTTAGVGYDYFWDPDATNGTWGENSGGFGTSLPSGTYEASGDLCDLVGCPLNGEWSFTVTDNLGADNGYIFAWGINFNPVLIPGLTTFTPTVGAGADSSFWSGPFITWQDAGLDVIQVDPPQPGSYDYTYSVVNSFGCQFDTTITIVVEQSPFITAGPDLVFSCEPLQINGGFQDLPTPLCSVDEGTYNYCYGENTNYVVTYCPDNPGDGFSAVEWTFIQGSTEEFFDQITIYNGDNTNAPILAANVQGDLSGLVYTASNPTGCLTLQFTSDGSVSCASGFETEWLYQIGCASPVDYVWEWTPGNGLTTTTSPVTTLETLANTETFTLTGYPIGIPECSVSDDVVVTIVGDMTMDIEDFYELCPGDTTHVNAPIISGGTGPYDIEWTDFDGSTIQGDEFDYTSEIPVEICVTVSDQCGVALSECTNIILFPEIPATFSPDSALGCEPFFGVFVSDYTIYQDIDQMIWHSGEGQTANTIGSAAFTYDVQGTYYPWLEITDIHGCVYSDTLSNPIVVWPTPFAVFNTNPDIAILPNTTVDFINMSIDGGSYVWTFDYLGTSTAADITYTFPEEAAMNYNVQLYVENEYGCMDSTTRQVIIQDDIDVYIPNTFTPNGDGVNDAWLIQGKGFQSEGYKMQVFNRWGDVIFESNDPEQAWTGGTDNSSYYVPDGIYLYRAEIRDIQNDVTYTYEGHVMIVR